MCYIITHWEHLKVKVWELFETSVGRDDLGQCAKNMGNVSSSDAWPENLGFPKIRGTILRVPIIRILVYWGPPNLGNYHLFPFPIHPTLKTRRYCEPSRQVGKGL